MRAPWFMTKVSRCLSLSVTKARHIKAFEVDVMVETLGLACETQWIEADMPAPAAHEFTMNFQTLRVCCELMLNTEFFSSSDQAAFFLSLPPPP